MSWSGKTAAIADILPQTVQLPYKIPGTTLLVHKLASYDGPYLEDGSNDEVQNVAALTVQNVGAYGLETAKITMAQGDDTYCFEGEILPPGETVLILEKDRKPFILQNSWTACRGEQVASKGDWTAYRSILVKPTAPGQLTVTNISAETVTDVILYYKDYLAPPGILIGGITYRTCVDTLRPGESVTISPWHYIWDQSTVIRIDIPED